MAPIQIPNKWRPRSDQLRLWEYLEGGGKRALEIAHRRWGKDDVALNWTAVSAIQKPATYWHMLPEASQARKAIWDAVNPHTGVRRIDQAFPPSIRAATRENEMFIRLKNGATWQVVGSDNFNSLVGSPPYGIVFSEWALADPEFWQILEPILIENGGWSLFITTPRGNNHAARMYQGLKDNPLWHCEKISATQTAVFSAEQLEEVRRNLITINGEAIGAAIFEQEYLVSFEGAIPGQVYAAELRQAQEAGRITKVPYDPSKPVHTFWDLGWADSTSVWLVQIVGFQIRVIDFIQGQQKPLNDYLQQLQSCGYVYGTDWLPHDAQAKQLGTGRSVEELMRGAGRTVRIVPRLGISDGINALRTTFPNLWIDAEKCKSGLDSLKAYHYEVKEGELSRNPVHDWSSHAADAARYMAIALRDAPEHKPFDPTPPTPEWNMGQSGGLGWMR